MFYKFWPCFRHYFRFVRPFGFALFIRSRLFDTLSRLFFVWAPLSFSLGVECFSPDATETRKIKEKKTETLVGCGRSLMQQNRVLQNPNKKSEGEEDKEKRTKFCSVKGEERGEAEYEANPRSEMLATCNRLLFDGTLTRLPS